MATPLDPSLHQLYHSDSHESLFDREQRIQPLAPAGKTCKHCRAPLVWVLGTVWHHTSLDQPAPRHCHGFIYGQTHEPL